MKSFARITWRASSRSKEGRARELPRLFDEPDQRRRVVRNTDDLQLVPINPKFGRIRMVGKDSGELFENDDRRWRLALPALKCELGQWCAGGSNLVHRETDARKAAKDFVSLRIKYRTNHLSGDSCKTHRKHNRCK